MTVPESPPPDKSPGATAPTKALESDVTKQPSTGGNFESYMKTGAESVQRGQAAKAPSPMEAAHPPSPKTAAPTLDTLITQAKTAQDSLGTVQKQLQTPDLRLKRSQAHLLKNKLTDAQTYSRSAAAKLGVETAPMRPLAPGSGIIERFLGYIGDGQDQFIAVQNELKGLAKAGKQLDAGDMMLVQAKMNLAQQEIEYSATLLSKITSAITTVLGIQI